MAFLLGSPKQALTTFVSLKSVINIRTATTLKNLQVKRKTRWRPPRDPSKPRRAFRPSPLIKPEDLSPTVKWSSLYQTAKSFDPYLTPIPIRMGRPGPGELPQEALGNVELLKIFNFCHLSPSAVDKQCEALKPLCTEWPSNQPPLTMRVHTRQYVFPANSPRHPASRKVKISVNLSDIVFDSSEARQKLLDLVGERYNESTNQITLACDRCPTRLQNKEYLIYLLKILYLESHRPENEVQTSKVDE